MRRMQIWYEIKPLKTMKKIDIYIYYKLVNLKVKSS